MKIVLPHTRLLDGSDKIGFQEHGHGVIVKIAIGFLTETVAFVFREQVPDPAAIFADNFHHLLTFAGGHPRVVQPLGNKHGFGDFRRIIIWRNLVEKFTHLWIYARNLREIVCVQAR